VSPSRLLRPALALLAWGCVLALVLDRFAPGTAPVTGWNSDAAIPVLQANDPVFDVYRLYYYGQDRIGAWPWLLGQALRALTGFDWTPDRMFVWQALCTLLALPVLLRLHRAAGPVLASTYAALALLSPLFQVQLFALSQPFGWQLTVMLLAWWALVRLVERLGAEPLVRGRGTAGWAVLALLGSALACWTSPTSGPLLVVGVALAALPPWLARPAVRTRLWLAALPVVAGFFFEVWVRRVYHRFTRARFEGVASTRIQVDLGHLGENARGVLGRLLEHPLLPLMALGAVLGACALGRLWRAWRRGELGAEDVPLASLCAGLAGAAAVNALINVLVRHVRLNGHDIRYLVPTVALGVLAAAAGAVLLLAWWAPRALRARLPAVGAGLGGALLTGALLATPPRVEEPTGVLARAQGAVDALLAQRPGGAVLLGGYWDTYLLASLDPELRLAPLVPRGDWQRMPFHLPRLQQAEEVFVPFFQSDVLGSAERPTPFLLQAGRLFALDAPRWAVHPPFTLARYASAQARTAPVSLAPARFEPWTQGAELEVRFGQPLHGGLLVVGTASPAAGVSVRAPGAVEARLEGVPGVWLVHLRAAPGGPPLRSATLRVEQAHPVEQRFFGGVALLPAEAPGAAPAGDARPPPP
jgi:hypothetical protein